MMVAETNRLIISKLTLYDAPFFLELSNSPNWIKYIGDRNLKTVDDAKTYLKEGTIKSYEEFGFGFYKLQLKEEKGKPIGTCGLVKRERLDNVDIGFAMLPEYEGKGFGFEASEAILKLAKEIFNLDKVLAITLPSNTNSIKLLEKLGLSFEKTVKPFEDEEELLLFAKDL
ncbi:GNAT family N-acetyltransferase [Xanthomarina sp. F2636L]|uniref:GNAT family N-acetyltransferase n=1 Tax=Xanthomarina sp. F2636L TaxID=2996018 RepID=UPI00225E1D4B|nr:GNAT family N-acetyltransferase [Xanthomarina sp. F2636L]MCX7551531.1 GNAT family N-acetyltransferase [Xanthomarina sp. F2636L]